MDYPRDFRGLTPGSTSIGSTVLTVRDVVARIPDLKVLFEKTFRSQSQCHAAFIFVLDTNTVTHVEVMESEAGVLEPDQLTDLLQLSASTPTRVQPLSERAARFVRSQDSHPEDIEVIWTSFPHASVNDLLPHLSRVKNDQWGNIYLVAPLPNGVVLSSMSLLFLLSYIMGMLVRYYPSIWQSLIARESGDVTFPLLRAAMALIRDQFPHLIVNELEDVHPKFPRVT